MNAIKLISRSFRKNKRLNLINITSMALGITATIIIAGYVYQEFNYDMRHENSNRIFRILYKNSNNELSGNYSYGPLAQTLKNEIPEIENSVRTSFFYGYLALTAGDNMYNEKKIIFVDPDFFNLFSFPLVKGDVKNCLGSPNSIALSEKAALKYFGNKDILGNQIKIGEDRIFNVSAVYKDFPKNSNFEGDIILPLEVISHLTQVWIEPSWQYPTDINTFVLLDKNAYIDEVSKKIEDFQFAYVKEEPEKLLLQPLKSFHTEKQIGWESTPQANKSYLYFLAAVAILILIMSGANFLLLYIGTSAQRILNTGVKKFCGASKTIIFREHIKEILSYFVISTLIALGCFYFYNNLLTSKFTFLPTISGFNFRLIIFLFLLLSFFAVLISIVPSFLISSQKTAQIFNLNRHAIIGQSKFINMLVTGQFALSIILIAVTLLFYKQLQFLEKHDPGFAKDELITIPLNMHLGDGIYNENMDVFADELKKQTGIENVSLAFSSPTNIQTSTDNFDWDGKPEDLLVPMQWNAVFFDYFETLDLDIVQGRSFSKEFPGDIMDYDNGQKCSYILNQKAIEKMGLTDPIGKTFKGYGEGPIVGIVEDFNFKSLHSEIKPMCFSINPIYFNEIIVRINPQVTDVLDNIEKIWKKFVPDYPLEFSYVTDQLNTMYKSENNLTASLNTFAAIAILIACMGLLSLTILSMQKRTKEIGIRKVNGAKVKELLTMLNKDFLKWVGFAFIIACPAAWLTMTQWLKNFAYKTEISWWIFAFAGVVAFTIALLTISWNSIKAATKNPVEALKYE